MVRSSAQGVDPPVCRVLDVAATHARDSSCLFRRAICPLKGGGGGGVGGGRQAGIGLTRPNSFYFAVGLY